MTVTFGYKLKDYIENDSDVINIINEGYKKANSKEEYNTYNINNLNISTIFITVKKVGEIYHGIKIIIPITVDINKLKNKIYEITDDLNQDVKLSIKENNKEYELYVECENIIMESIDEYADLNSNESIQDLYTLFKNK